MPDARVQAAIDNWAPRFVAQGVDYNDFVRTTASIERWDNWLDAWVKLGDEHTALAQAANAAGRNRTAGEAYVRAALSYHFAKFIWMVDPVRHREASERAIASMYAAHRSLDPTAERLEVPFEGTHLVGNLRRPGEAAQPGLVLLLPGLDSTKEEFFHWENVFLQRGLATLSMDGPGQGETGYHTHIRHDYEVAVSAALDALMDRADLDMQRVGVVGVSLGGYYAPRAGAFEHRLKAVAAIGGPYNFGECWPGLPPITREAFIHHSGAMSDDQAQSLAARLDLEGVLPRMSQPFLIVFGKLDRLIPWQHAERMAAEAPMGELVMYPEGNHVCNNIPYKYRPLVADWIGEQLRNVG
jgi:pimeloyl-ACP methyl ester carboxylesterase